MRNILIVAEREFKQITAMRSFWLTLLILPLALSFGPLASKFLKDDDASRLMIVDRSGGAVASALAARIDDDQQREVLGKLSRYVRRHDLAAAGPGQPWAEHDRYYTEADVAAFRASGGLPAALKAIDRVKPSGVPEFKAPDPDYAVVPAAPALAAAPPEGVEQAAQPLLHPADKAVKAVDTILVIPADFTRTGQARLLANSDPSPRLMALVQDVLTRQLRTGFLQSQGLSPQAATAAGQIAPALAVSTPPPGGGLKEAMVVRSVLPLAACYLLMMSLMLSGSWMLQGSVEERGNKLIEVVLACVSPEELMYGKLIGTVAVGMLMIAVWILCGVVAATATQGAIADFIRPAVEPLRSPGTIATMIFFLVVGYVSISLFFLAIGAMTESMREAQGYLMPVMLALILPVTVLIQAVLSGGGGVALTVLTFVPIWTPFTVLARLGSGIPTWQVLVAGALLLAWTALQLVMLGRLFRQSLLATGQKPSLKVMIDRMRARAG
ncbi:ABC transporter permease [Sphingomonas sp. KRR8]|uniref:ABC transporter permease n=1 Tax=Sphingomonas sp. KRR8 TaxID=2942996 RepID=UPI0020215F81|nr:ABC transporter permease [Sphingomonas sp. KRR8]URD61985.1 ABC transporter permease [Sphingomonas sp. KRR8]